MKKLLFTVALMATATAVFADTPSTSNDGKPRTHRLSAAERRAKREARVKAEGGLVTKPMDGRYVVIENAQSIVAEKELMPEEQSITRIFNYPVKFIKKGERETKTAVHITVSDDKNAPTLLIAPEIPWAQVGVKALAQDNPSHLVLVSRVQKEIWRAFMMCCGAANSNMQPCVMRTVRSVQELDAQSVRIPCPEPFMKVVGAAEKLGLKRPVIATYKEACEQGWAPAPTNDLQKTIFSQYKK